MADEASRVDEVAPPQSDEASAPDAIVESKVEVPESANDSNGVQNEAVSEAQVATADASATEEVKDSEVETKTEEMENQAIPDHSMKEEPSAASAPEDADTELKDVEQSESIVVAVDESAEPVDAAADTPASASKSKSRRKSGGVPEHKKKLNRKQSKAKLTHIDAKPGDYFFVRLKGYPLWPAIVCDEDMLPSTLLKSRPVTAMRADGSYRSDYEDGGAKAKDRTFPVMYLFTNEFGWIPNYDLLDLDLDTVGDVPNNMRKDLYAAHQLAAEKNDLDYFKTVLTEFMEQKRADEEAREAAKAAKKAKKEKTPKVLSGEDEDVEMLDVSAMPDDDESEAPKSNQKKRKNPPPHPEEDTQPDSAPKKPRIKLNNTPKAVNGASTPKTAKEPKEPKSAKEKSKPKKAAAKPKEAASVALPEPELSPEEKRVKKEKEILFLRHKLQKGLLTKDQDPKADEMQQMSDYINKLEGYADLEVSIIRATKINKVLKAILKLHFIPKEEEFQFKPKSQALLDKWNKLLASEQVAPAATEGASNGMSVETKVEDEPKADAENANGVVENDDTKEKSPALETPLTALPKEEVAINDDAAPAAEESPKEAEATVVESTEE